MNGNGKEMALTSDIQMLISGIIPNTKYFDSRFDHLQVQIDEVRRNQDYFREQTRDFKLDMDRKFDESKHDMLERFEQVDKRFEQVDKRFEQVDKRFDESRRDMLERFDESRRDMLERFKQVDKRFEQVDKRFDESRRDTMERFDKVDKRFDKVDKRFEQMIASIDKIGDKLDKRDEKHRSFTIRMFTIAITISIFGVFGVFIKTLGII